MPFWWGCAEGCGRWLDYRRPRTIKPVPWSCLASRLKFRGLHAVSNWPSDKALRRLTVLPGAKKFMAGIALVAQKTLAFLRMLKSAPKRQDAGVVIMPVAPLYADEFLNPDIAQRFEEV